MENKNKKDAEKMNRPPASGNSGLGVIIFLAVLAVLLAVGGAYLLRQVLDARYEAQVSALEIKEVSDERDLLEQQLNELDSKYEELSSEYAEMETKFLAERRRVNQLRAQVRGGDPGTVAQYKEQIEELEARLEKYQEEIEILESEKQTLEGENAQIRSTLETTTSRNQELEREFNQMEEQIEKATLLSISGLEATPIRERRRGDEPTDRARRTDKINVCFTVNENLVAEPGNREFFVRMIDPNNQVLTISPDDTIEFEGETIQYTLKRTINYRNEPVETCVVWDQDERFEKGYYNVVVFHDGREVGYKLFQLD